MVRNIFIFVFSRSVLAPSPNNPIDPTATPCDLKTVTRTWNYEIYFILFTNFNPTNYWISGHNLIPPLYFRITFLNCQILWGLNLDLKVEIFGKPFGLLKLITNCTSDRIIIQTNIANGFTFKYEFSSFRLTSFSK